MGKRLAESGYAVLVVNPFYRTKKAPTSSPHADFDDPATREALMGLAHSLTPETEVTDAKALTAWLDQQPSVDKSRKMGTTGYCMGGPLVMRTAATNPDRIGAAATFHGGGLVTDKPDSPHLLIPKMKAHFLIAIAANDDAKQPDAKGTLKGVRPGVSPRECRSVRRDDARLVSAGFPRVQPRRGGEGMGRAPRAVQERARVVKRPTRQ
jgi:carboxymethylenebutenolidase